MKQSIIDIIEKGGTISVPHKSKINEWYGELKISKLGKNEYVIQPYWQKFSDIEEEDAIADIESLVKNLTVSNLKDSLSEFEKKYMTLDPYISVSFVYDTETSGKKHEYSSGIDYESFSEKVYNRYKNLDKSCVYKHVNLTIKLRKSDEYKRYNLNF